MRTDAPPLEHAATGLVVHATADVLYGGRVVNSRPVPVVGREVRQADQDVPERLDVSLPRVWEGITLDPSRKGGLLGCDGHQLAVTVHLSTPVGDQSWTQARGRFQVQSWSTDGASVRVMGHGLLQVLADRLRAAPGGVSKASPIRGEIMNHLAEADLVPWFHPDLPQRPLPAGFTWGEEPMKALQELVTVWPARMRALPDGRIGFFPPLTEDVSPVLWWHDGEGGTVVGAPVEGTRDGIYNHFIVPVHNDDAGRVAERSVMTGRLAVGTYGKRSQRVESDAVVNLAQAQAVAAADTAKAGLRARTVPVEMVPDWRVELDDPAEVRTSDGVREWGRVTGIDFPLSAGDGPGRVEIGVVT